MGTRNGGMGAVIGLALASTSVSLVSDASAEARMVAVPTGDSASGTTWDAQNDIEHALAGFHRVREGLYSGGQPSVDSWIRLSAGGVTTVINLRPDDELPGRDEAHEVRAQEMGYIHIPIDGPADITVENADRLWREVEASAGPVLVHCASGNRVGALLALGAQRHAGMSAEAALAFGKSAGLLGLEPVVRRQLGLLPAE